MLEKLIRTLSLTLFIIVIGFTQQLVGASEHNIIRWINTNHLHNQLDLISGKFQQELRPGKWTDAKKVELIGVNLSDFPSEYNIHSHKVKSGYLFNVPGTGLVFSLDSDNKQFKRIDNTFFRGFNFHSFSFVRKDTLYSIGGEGFWNTNSTLIYFDKKHQEWEKVNLKNRGPLSLEWEFGGYCNRNDIFYALNGFDEFKENVFSNKLLYSLNLTTNLWKELGYLNTQPFTYQITKAKAWLGDFLIYIDGNKPNVYILDPIENRILLYEGPNNQLKLGSNEIIRDKDKLFIYRKENQGIIIDSITIKELFRDSREVGKLYFEKIEFPLIQVVSGALLLSVLIALYFFLRMKKFERKYLWFQKSERIEELPAPLFQVLRHFQMNGIETMLTTNQMNELLGIKSNSFETTRQQRSRDIKAINDFFQVHHNIADAIIRGNSETDKRQTIYCMDEKAFKIISKMNFDIE